ncbi:THUMP-like domain-containing protein [Gaetbulibacter saemankumensis]|uniref:THUMP-like domain-containing protein n=1 Tax=Gaetbulibacter saemankumensis TaxID=311208 RepID=UPI00042314D2|nr:SAM-dependent methyltransferase [Gaetbulibacter saemankumensis]
MNPFILNSDIQKFISDNLNTDINSLLLKGTSFPQIETKELIEQIEAKKRCEKKLPSWFHTKGIYFPNKLNIEQTSSEATAKYKAELIQGASIIDLTGGFGVDCYYFSKRFQSVTHCEINPELSEIVTHNYKQLYVKNIKTCCGDGIQYLKDTSVHCDWIYVDPSRRHDSKGKVFFLNDCIPDVPKNIDLLFGCSKNILIKTSPLLDISVGLNELSCVKTIHVVALKNEVKELLWVLEKNYKGETNIKTINLNTAPDQYFEFKLSDEKLAMATYSEPNNFLYEANSAILKAGAFNSISQQLQLCKLHQHSHLYTSNTLIDFPGRTFRIESVHPYNKKALKKLGISNANITTRNFPETVDGIRKKFKIKDGGNRYLFFTTDIENNKIVIETTKI